MKNQQAIFTNSLKQRKDIKILSFSVSSLSNA